MIGRTAPANPWIFRQIAQYTASKEATGVGTYDHPTNDDRYRMIRTYFQMLVDEIALEEAAEAARAAAIIAAGPDRPRAAPPRLRRQDEAVRQLVHPRRPRRRRAPQTDLRIQKRQRRPRRRRALLRIPRPNHPTPEDSQPDEQLLTAASAYCD